MVIGWDLSTRLHGWCAGDGSRIPTAGAFETVERNDLGVLGAEFQTLVMITHRRFPAAAWYVERPLLTPHDHRFVLQKIYGVSFLLFTLANKLGVPCEFVDYDEAKREWAGFKKAEKPDMVHVCEKVGIALPKTQDQGRFDAADACGIWKVGLRRSKSPHLSRWDRAIYSQKGALL